MTRTPRQLDALAWRAAEQLGDDWEVTRRERTSPARDEWVVSLHARSQEGVTTATAQAIVSFEEVDALSDDDLVARISDRARSRTVANRSRVNAGSTR